MSKQGKRPKQPVKIDTTKIKPQTPVLEDVNTVVSATECTGLTPNNVITNDEAMSYEDIYPITMADKKENHKHQG